MDAAARRSMAININLDSVGGAPGLTALTSGFERLDAWVKATAARAGLPIATHLPLMPNSDHANFAAHGIPAVRLIAGFNSLRLVLTEWRNKRNQQAVLRSVQKFQIQIGRSLLDCLGASPL